MGTKRKWNELDFYKEGQTLYGRDEEIYSISNGIVRNTQTVIYGQSGVGKSSLLFAGIFPELRKQMFFPVFIRLGVLPSGDYVEKIKEFVINEAKIYDPCVGKQPLAINDEKLHGDEDLWTFFHSIEFFDKQGEIYVPVLIFDQFEEILNDKRTYDDAKRLVLELYSLLDDNRIITEELIQYTNYRIVFSLREDYLYCLEELIDQFNLSELRHNRYRIKCLNEYNAQIVIVNTFGSSLNPNDVGDICELIIQNAKNVSGDISTICLSLICSILEIKCGENIVSYSDLNSIEDYLYKYYNQKLDTVPHKAKKYLEQHLITPDGRRNSIDYNEAIRSGKITKDDIDQLISNRLLRLVSLTGNCRIEYIHDIIPQLVVKKKHNIWYYLKKTFKERHNITGTATKQEMVTSNIVLCLLIFIIDLSVIVLSTFYFEDFEDRLAFVIISYGFLSYFYFKLIWSLHIRRAHDVGISGWNLFSMKFNEESAVIPYTPKTSYYYTMTNSFIDGMLGRYSRKSQIMKLAINKYEFLAQLVKSIKKTYLPLLFIVAITLSTKNQDIRELGFFWVGLYFYFEFSIFHVAFIKRLNYVGINPYYSLIPTYNVYLFIRCFRNDRFDNNQSQFYTSKFIHLFIPFCIAILAYMIILMLIFVYYLV